MKRAAIAAYSLALLAFPRRHRSAYAGGMLDAVARDLEARSHHSRITAARLAIAACVNAIDTGLDERRRQRHRRFGPLFSTLDVVLDWRMLLRYPGLSLVAVMGIAVGIAIASGAYAIMATVSNPTVPLD